MPPVLPPKPKAEAPFSGRRWLGRALLLLGLPVVFFSALEGGLRVAGYGRAVQFLIPDEQPGFFRTNPTFVSSFLPGTFDLRPLNWRIAMPKPAGTLRVVVLGESAVQGVPAPAFGFVAQLRAQLRARFPGRTIEVLNTGIVAINSHVIYQIARQLADFAPDVFVVYAGNNEVVGPYGPGSPYAAAMPPLGVIRLSLWVRQSRTGQLINAVVGRLARGSRKSLEWGGMSMFVQSTVAADDPRLEAVYANFETNLRDIVRIARRAGAPTLLCTVGCNLRDCAPFISRHRPGRTADELSAWKRASDRGRIEWLLGQWDGAQRDLTEARRLDPDYADTAWLLGDLAVEQGNLAASRQFLVAAEHLDALRFRPDPRINAAVRTVAREFPGHAQLLDLAQLLGSDPGATTPPAGRNLFLEHVHLDWSGNFQVAQAMAGPVAAWASRLGPVRGAALDEAACAAAVGYTPAQRLSVLQHIGTIIQNAPFTGQLTYVEDQARLVATLADAQSAATDATLLRQADEVVRMALVADPSNPDLMALAENLADGRGETAAALAWLRRAEALQPQDFALATDEAIHLGQLGRDDEAEALLRATRRTCTPRDRALMAPAFGGLFARTGRWDEGRRFLDGEIAARPRDASLLLVRAQLERQGNDLPAAEADYRAALALEPTNKAAQNDLVKLWTDQRRTAEANRQVLSGAETQPLNAANDLHAAVLADQQGDAAQEIRFLEAAEHSGPVSAAVEMQLAREEFERHQLEAGLEHLAWARRVVRHEGNPQALAEIEATIGQVLGRLQRP